MREFLWFFTTSLFLIPLASALETNCSLMPNQINAYATKMAQEVHLQNTNLPDSIILQTNVEMQFDSKKGSKFYGTVEGFFRPAEDDFISPTQLPVLGFDLTRDRIVLYVCANYDENPANTHFTVYFLRGYRIDKLKYSNFFGDIINGAVMKISPVPASLIGINKIKKFFLGIFKYIPFSDIYFDSWSLAQQVVANLFGDVTGVGVERIEITPEYLKISSKVNLDSPRQAWISKTFLLNKEEVARSNGEFKIGNVPVKVKEIVVETVGGAKNIIYEVIDILPGVNLKEAPKPQKN
ncbi:MAG: hypothetical protein L6Q37_04715 [Bdellovibrionaceae bacterium]|nr:hypothetical protein [Pseudobdellovibrionaceae bacterium]NUM59980.1 hypothetical protein [Pseudobdellovibrionaceae bacterium]